MLRRFFIWRAEKRMGRSRYRFDKRHYQGVFRAGFFAHLNQTKFWQSDDDPYQRSRRRKKKAVFVLIILLMTISIWVAIESSRALSLF